MKRSRMNLLIQHLVSYFLVLLFPLLIILAYYYPHSTAVVKQKEMDWNTHLTEQVKTSLDTFTRYVYNLPFELLKNREIKLYNTEDNDYQRVQIANEMRKYNATDGFIDNTLLYIESMGYLFAKTGSAYNTGDFSKPGIGYYYKDWPDMFSELGSLKGPTVRPVEDVIIPGSNHVRMLTFALPLPIGGYETPGAVLIMVREDTIIRMLNSMSEMYSGDFFILDGEGHPLLTSSKGAYIPTDEVQSFLGGLAKNGKGAGFYEKDGSSYIISHTVSDKNGWQYVSVLPVTEMLQGIQAIQRNTIAMIGMMLLLEFLIIYISIRRNYQPIKRIVDFAANLFEPAGRKPMNEFEMIRFALGELVSANSSLDARVKQTMPVLRDNMLLELVSGKAGNDEAFMQQAAGYGIAFPHEAVAVAVLSVESSKTDEAMDCKVVECLRSMETSQPQAVAGYFLKSIYSHEMIYVCSHEADFNMKQFLAEIRLELEEQTGAKILIGIGIASKPDRTEAIHVAYLQAVRATEHQQLRGGSPVIVFDELHTPKSGTVSYYAELLQSLELVILKNDAGSVRSITERIVTQLRSEGMPPHMVRSVYINTVSALLNGLQRFSPEDDDLLRLTDTAYQFRYTVEQMADIIRDSCDRLCRMIQNTLPQVRNASQDEMTVFIEQKGLIPDFSLQLIADHFSMSPSNFSHHFKKTMGQNFKEYIDIFRIQTSIQLLRTTDQTLEGISQQTGFSNTSSFIRCFKKIVGTTPGQYRETHKLIS
ncbi:helix-turn-helix domain-containing protein [Paenibacillus glycanilyticus]|uniref:helix-turn-helix domain-containing protein n=1 Tax=Paenibacillus glycanilyticus TaxID=126569 RepID=UPI00203A58D8|nr:helix-turn-helix domain-containing protein [Paenibacillus glycanilyticus]MCM3626632.1 helix-turn-helix domain-containing protein [Paenibacillus glycanilyticus]